MEYNVSILLLKESIETWSFIQMHLIKFNEKYLQFKKDVGKGTYNVICHTALLLLINNPSQLFK